MEKSFQNRYIEFLKSRLEEFDFNLPSSGLNIGIDCSNGMASLLAHEIFPGAEIINDTLDGTFPNHSPNPLKAEAREQIAALVRDKGLDLGIIFDGDADRAMFVDEKGEFVQPDYLIPIIAKSCLASRSAYNEGSEHCTPSDSRGLEERGRPKVLHDVRTSRGAIETLREMGCEPVMVPVGHAFAKPKMRETGAICGGELAGHYYFKEFFGCDSAFLASIHVLAEFEASRGRSAYNEKKTFSAMMEPIVSRYANSGELNFKVEDKDAAIARVLNCARSLAKEISRSEIDGIRVEFKEGWLNVRKSNTEPYLRLIVEARGAELLDDWVGKLREVVSG